MPKWSWYVLIAVAVPALVLASHAAAVGNVPISAVTALVFTPVAVAGMYLWFYGTDSPYVNIPSKHGDRRKASSIMGPFMAAQAVVLSLAVPALVVKMYAGIVLIVVGVVLLIASAAAIRKKVDSYQLPSFGTGAKAIAVIGVALLATVPATVLSDTVAKESVEITFYDDGFAVKAPMFDNRFHYSDIQDCRIEKNFDRGARIYGYAGPDICSGKWNNGLFGTYELAMYTCVKDVIAFSEGGAMYAFNLHDIQQTKEAFDTISGHLYFQ